MKRGLIRTTGRIAGDSRTLRYYQMEAADLVNRYEQAGSSGLHARIARVFQPGELVLELGCGSGRESSFLLGHGCRLVATDAVHSMLAQAGTHHPELAGVLIQVILPEPLPFRDRTFDGVLAVAVMMHLPDWALRLALAEVARVLKPQGRFYLSVPAARDDLSADGRDAHGRFFAMRDGRIWAKRLAHAGIEPINAWVTTDGLGRAGCSWQTLVGRRQTDPGVATEVT